MVQASADARPVAAIAQPRERFVVAGTFAADIEIGSARVALPMRVRCEATGADLAVRYELVGHPRATQALTVPGAAAIIAPAILRLLASAAVALPDGPEPS